MKRSLLGVGVVVVLAVLAAPAIAEPAETSIDGPSQVQPGENVTYTFTLTNAGENESAYLLNATLPDGWEIVDRNDDGGNWQDSDTEWLYLPIEPGATKSPSLTVSVPDRATDGTIEIASVVSTSDGVQDSAAREVTVETDSDGGADENNTTEPATTSIDGPAEVQASENVTYTFRLTNTGDNESSYLLNATLPDGWAIVDRADDGGSWQDSDTEWVYSSVDPGGTKAPSFTVSVPEGTSGGTVDITSVVSNTDGEQDSATEAVTVEVDSDDSDGGDGSSGGSDDSDGGDGSSGGSEDSDGGDGSSGGSDDSDDSTDDSGSSDSGSGGSSDDTGSGGSSSDSDDSGGGSDDSDDSTDANGSSDSGGSYDGRSDSGDSSSGGGGIDSDSQGADVLYGDDGSNASTEPANSSGISGSNTTSSNATGSESNTTSSNATDSESNTTSSNATDSESSTAGVSAVDGQSATTVAGSDEGTESEPTGTAGRPASEPTDESATDDASDTETDDGAAASDTGNGSNAAVGIALGALVILVTGVGVVTARRGAVEESLVEVVPRDVVEELLVEAVWDGSPTDPETTSSSDTGGYGGADVEVHTFHAAPDKCSITYATESMGNKEIGDEIREIARGYATADSEDIQTQRLEATVCHGDRTVATWHIRTEWLEQFTDGELSAEAFERRAVATLSFSS